MPFAKATETRREMMRILAMTGSLPFVARPAPACDGQSLLLLSSCDPMGVKQLAEAGNAAVETELTRLHKDATRWLAQGPWSVTSARPHNTPAGMHDFFSEGPYWWPDPANSNAPYVRRDGDVNPQRFTENHSDLSKLCDAVMCLATAAHLLPEVRGAEQYGQHAWNLVRVWFADSKTRMNPNLEFGQAIRGRAWGRGIGLIDTVPMIHLVQGVMLLSVLPDRDASTEREFRAWLRDFLGWMLTSEKGIDERDEGNNHSTWWAAQVAAYATYFKDDRALLEAWKLYFEKLVPGQLMPDGSAPKEEARTRSLSYSAMNLDGLAVLCRMGQFWNMELWEYEAANGASVAKSVAYLMPFLEDPTKWKKPQITPFDRSRSLFPALAGWGLAKPAYLDAQKRFGCDGREFSRWVRLLLAMSASG
jgi:hypothetical protein